MATIQIPSVTEAELEAPMESDIEPEKQLEATAKLKRAAAPKTPVAAGVEPEILLE